MRSTCEAVEAPPVGEAGAEAVARSEAVDLGHHL